MVSRALQSLYDGIDEIDALQRANPTPAEGGGLTRPEITRAMGRAEVVLLSSHLEQFIYGLTEDSVAFVVDEAVVAENIPLAVRLQNVRVPLDQLLETQWDNRADQLLAYTDQHAPLWAVGTPVQHLDADRILMWMKSPNPRSLTKAFKMWGIADIFSAITTKAKHRNRLRWRIDELVTKRNNIAHGDFTVEATHLDVGSYRRAVREFCERADKQMSRRLAALAGTERPW